MDFTLFLYVLFIMGFSQAHRAAFLPAVSGIVGKGLEREIMRPFLCLRRFGAHSETPFSSPFFRRTAFLPGHGTVLFIEGVSFEIVDDVKHYAVCISDADGGSGEMK